MRLHPRRFREDETPRLRWVQEHIETLATRFELKRSFRVGGNQLWKLRNERRLHKEFDEYDKGPDDSSSQAYFATRQRVWKATLPDPSGLSNALLC